MEPIDRDILRTLKRRLFVSRHNNQKIEKSFREELDENGTYANDSAPLVSGNCSLLASNYYTANGNLMPFMIGLEYCSFRYMNIETAYDPYRRKTVVDPPSECSECGTDFTTQWCRDEETGKIRCFECAKKPILKKVNKIAKKQIKRSIVKCFEGQIALVKEQVERKRRKKEAEKPAEVESEVELENEKSDNDVSDDTESEKSASPEPVESVLETLESSPTMEIDEIGTVSDSE